MTEDPRCCGTGTCIINEDGVCWCGQAWDGEKMCMPSASQNATLQDSTNTVETLGRQTDGSRNASDQFDKI